MHFSVSLVVICAGVALAAPLRAPQMTPGEGTTQGQQIGQGAQPGSTRSGYPSDPDADSTVVDTTRMSGSGMQNVRGGRGNVAQNAPGNDSPTVQPGTVEFDGKPLEPYENGYSGGPSVGDGYVPATQGDGPPRKMFGVRRNPSTNRLDVTRQEGSQLGTGPIAQRLAEIPSYKPCPESKKCETDMEERTRASCFNRVNGQSGIYTQEICALQLKAAVSGCRAACDAAALKRGEAPTVATNVKNSRTAMRPSMRFPDAAARNVQPNAPESINVVNNNNNKGYSPLGTDAEFIMADGGPESDPTGQFGLSAPIPVPNPKSYSMPGSPNAMTRPLTNSPIGRQQDLQGYTAEPNMKVPPGANQGSDPSNMMIPPGDIQDPANAINRAPVNIPVSRQQGTQEDTDPNAMPARVVERGAATY